MEKLEKLVKKLESASGENMQIRILQAIGAILIHAYRIEIGNLIIEPLLVEAYYYREGKFNDTSVYASGKSESPTYRLARERQQNNFGKLFVHYGTKDGIDIVLSMEDGVYLSFLIKTARVNGVCKRQCAISNMICGACERHDKCKGFACKYYGEKVLKPLDGKDVKYQDVVFLPRKGIKNAFAQAPLAVLSAEVFKKKEETDEIVKSLEKGCRKQWVLAKYALAKSQLDIEKAREFITEKGLYQDKIEDQYMADALKYMEEQET